MKTRENKEKPKEKREEGKEREKRKYIPLSKDIDE